MVAAIFSEKMALIVVTVIGMAMCTPGIGRVAARGEWLHPISIFASLLGALMLTIVGLLLFNVKMPLVDSTRAAIVAVVVVILAKLVLTQIHRVML